MVTTLTPEEKNLFKEFFDIDKDIKLTIDDINYLKDLSGELISLIAEHGEVGETRIREIVTDTLYKDDEQNIIDYLNLDIEDEIEESLKTKLQDPEFLKVEETEDKGDFFSKYLQDDTLNDLIMSLKGYERKAEGSKEVFLKKRKALIPNTRIDAIRNNLTAMFNKTNFLSLKDDNEQAKLIIMAYEHIFEILLETPYICCDAQKTIEILSMISIKLSNMIGLSQGFRADLLETIRESYKSQKQTKDADLAGVLEE